MKSRCGSVIGYLRHFHRRTPICGPCQAAWNIHDRRTREANATGSEPHTVMGRRLWLRCLKWTSATGQCTEVEKHEGDCVWPVAS